MADTEDRDATADGAGTEEDQPARMSRRSLVLGTAGMALAPGAANIVEMQLDVRGRSVLVDHALSRAERGLAGYLIVDGAPNPEIFNAPESMDGMGH
jgi:hypothetical protein